MGEGLGQLVLRPNQTVSLKGTSARVDKVLVAPVWVTRVHALVVRKINRNHRAITDLSVEKGLEGLVIRPGLEARQDNIPGVQEPTEVAVRHFDGKQMLKLIDGAIGFRNMEMLIDKPKKLPALDEPTGPQGSLLPGLNVVGKLDGCHLGDGIGQLRVQGIEIDPVMDRSNKLVVVEPPFITPHGQNPW